MPSKLLHCLVKLLLARIGKTNFIMARRRLQQDRSAARGFRQVFLLFFFFFDFTRLSNLHFFWGVDSALDPRECRGYTV